MRRVGPRQNPLDWNNRVESGRDTLVSLERPEPISIRHDFRKPPLRSSKCSICALFADIGPIFGTDHAIAALVTRVTKALGDPACSAAATQKALDRNLISPL